MKNIVIQNKLGLYWTGRKWSILQDAKRFTHTKALELMGNNPLGHTLIELGA